MSLPVGELRGLLEGRLHPGTIVVRLLRLMPNFLLWAVVISVSLGWWALTVVPVMMLANLIPLGLHYFNYRYRLEPRELVFVEGILGRKERRIPLQRIQDLSFEQSPLRRLFGLVVVRVETAGTAGAEASIDSIALGEAERLRDKLRAAARAVGGASVRTEDAPSRTLHRSTLSALLTRGLTDLRAGPIAVAVGGAWQLVQETGYLDEAIERSEELAGTLVGLDASSTLGIAVVVVVLILVLSWALSVGTSLLLFYGFELTESEGLLSRAHGLLTSRTQSIPIKRIQRMRVEQSAIRRWLGRAVVRADHAGSALDSSLAAKSGLNVLAPLASRDEAFALVRDILGMEAPDRHHPVSRRCFGRVSFRLLLLLTLVTAGLALAVDLVFGWLALLAPLALLLAWLHYRRLGWARTPDAWWSRTGWFGESHTVVPEAKIQCVRLQQTPVDRWRGLATLSVEVAGGATTRVPYLPVETARELRDALAAAAVSHPGPF